MHYKETNYGFEWGALKVERLGSFKGYVVLGITTPYQTLEVTTSPTGRVLRTKQLKIRREER